MKDTITYVRKAPLARSIFGVAFFLFGIIVLGTGSLIPGLFICGLALGILTTEGAQLDLVNKKCRRIKSVAGIHFGTWSNFPEFEYVTVFKTSENKTVTIGTASTTSSDGIIMLNLFYKGNKHFTIYKTTDKAKAFSVAEKLRRMLNIDVLDATEKEKKWVEAV